MNESQLGFDSLVNTDRVANSKGYLNSVASNGDSDGTDCYNQLRVRGCAMDDGCRAGAGFLHPQGEAA